MTAVSHTSRQAMSDGPSARARPPTEPLPLPLQLRLELGPPRLQGIRPFGFGLGTLRLQVGAPGFHLDPFGRGGNQISPGQITGEPNAVTSADGDPHKRHPELL